MGDTSVTQHTLLPDGQSDIEIKNAETGEVECSFHCANGYVARCVSLIAEENYPDARWACEVLNNYGHLVKHAAERLATYRGGNESTTH